MPFEIAPEVEAPAKFNPWTAKHPAVARALRVLAEHLRTIPNWQWDYHQIGGYSESKCGTVGCAIGHANALGIAGACRNLPIEVDYAFYYNGQRGKCGAFVSKPYARGWDATQHDVADRIDHWLATGEIR